MLATAIVIGVMAFGCGGDPPSAPPASAAPVSTPAPTPVAHFLTRAEADQVFVALLAGGLRIVANNAGTAGEGREPIKRINATYEGWPLRISEYSTPANLVHELQWKDGSKPGRGEAPIAMLGLNILIEWGPTGGVRPRTPDERQLAAAAKLATVLDPLVSPLAVRTILPIPGRAAAEATPAPTAKPKPSQKPAKTPKPTKKP
jgi:hypothetical protein